MDYSLFKNFGQTPWKTVRGLTSGLLENCYGAQYSRPSIWPSCLPHYRWRFQNYHRPLSNLSNCLDLCKPIVGCFGSCRSRYRFRRLLENTIAFPSGQGEYKESRLELPLRANLKRMCQFKEDVPLTTRRPLSSGCGSLHHGMNPATGVPNVCLCLLIVDLRPAEPGDFRLQFIEMVGRL